MKQSEILQQLIPEIAPTIEGLTPPFLLSRVDKGSDRYYYKLGTNDAYLSMTSFVSKSMPTSPQLIEWITDRGADMSEYIKDESAAYGTWMHICCIESLKNGGGNFDEIRELTISEAISQKYEHRASIWAHNAVRDLMSFLVFINEYEVKPVAAEYPIASDKYGLGGMIDLPCTMNFNRARVNAIVDLKSGRKGFWPEHEMQLHGYKELWNEWFGDFFPVTHVFNWAPNDWRDKPTYKLKNQTNSKFANTIHHRMELARMEGWINPPEQYQFYTGDFKVEGFDFNENTVNLYPNEIGKKRE